MADDKVDLFKLHKDEYATPKTPALVRTKPGTYLTITGAGEPGGATFQAKLGALYGVAYTLKFAHKASGRDFKVAPLEGLWWGAEGETDLLEHRPSEWFWKLLMRIPEFVSQADLQRAIEDMLQKGKDPGAREVKREVFDEGLCVQVLHVGPYSEERKTIAAMKEYAAANGLSFHGHHHEIYLSDPRRVPEQRLKTILRFPVR